MDSVKYGSIRIPLIYIYTYKYIYTLTFKDPYRPDIMPPGVSVINQYKPFENWPFLGLSVHLGVCMKDR